MRTALIAFLILYAPASVAAEPASNLCDRIQRRDSQIAERREAIAQRLTRYTERHPEVIALRKELAALEEARAADAGKAKSQGLSCASDLSSEPVGPVGASPGLPALMARESIW